MSLTPQDANQFKKDMRRVMSQGKTFEKIRAVLKALVNQQPLDPKYRDHPLDGNWKGCRELHIQPDWLLIYKIADETLYLLRTGSHSELFG
jgi:mRNA interferase YafQ